MGEDGTTLDAGVTLGKALAAAGVTCSMAEGRRLARGGGLRLDGERVTDASLVLPTGSHEIKIGKRKTVTVTVTGDDDGIEST